MSDLILSQLISKVTPQARRLARRNGLQPADQDDVFQEIALDAWRRLKSYHAGRGELAPFLGLVTLHQARKIEARVRRRPREVSLDALLAAEGDDEAGLTFADSIGESEGLLAWFGNPVDHHGWVELTIDLTKAIAALRPECQALCASLAHETPGSARRICGFSNSGMYRRVAEVRLHFRAVGLGTSWEDSPGRGVED